MASNILALILLVMVHLLLVTYAHPRDHRNVLKLLNEKQRLLDRFEAFTASPNPPYYSLMLSSLDRLDYCKPESLDGKTFKQKVRVVEYGLYSSVGSLLSRMWLWDDSSPGRFIPRFLRKDLIIN